MKIVYFDCFSGISGDMVLGAVIDAGVDPEVLTTELAKLNLDVEFGLHFQKATKQGITGTQAIVETSENSHEGHHHKHVHGPSRYLSEIFNLLDASDLKTNIRGTAKQIFDRLAEAEAKVHNTDKAKVHLHEVSGIDSIVDIVGAVIGLAKLGIEEVYASPLSLGRGFVKCAHGMMPVPVPGTMELLHGVPVRQTDIPKELVTPTGAAIITTLAKSFGVMPNMTINQIGYGAGTRDLDMQPNLLRICVGEKSSLNSAKHHRHDHSEPLTSHDSVLGFSDCIEIIETNVDDMSPEISSYVMEKLFEHGALDVFFVPILMKKGRAAIKINVLCPSNIRDLLIKVLLTETTTFGVRFYAADRIILNRDYVEINTQWGPVRAKRGYLNGDLIKTVPEYEDCKSLAEQNGVSLQSVFQEALRKI
ncbi:MAG: nickel pincer cofactor biosynthesis protein LarC [Candidatus Poribacteria bacterium]|nr:nickel pincer cofactor biosynthesis protein LarC [Candidatus Poribacteria bacterium]